MVYFEWDGKQHNNITTTTTLVHTSVQHYHLTTNLLQRSAE